MEYIPHPFFHDKNVLGTLEVLYVINPFPDDKILALCKLTACANQKFSVAQKLQLFFFDQVENIVGKSNCCYQHFLLFS